MKLIVGLGNIGREYEHTRHNIGFAVLDQYAAIHNYTFSKEKFKGSYFETTINGEKHIFVKPLKYMNLSGEVVRDFVQFYKIDVNDILIISDDLDMEIGRVRLKLLGSSGGHNGLKNIALHLNTENFKRLKIGIANNKLIDTKDYVLGKLSKEEQKIIDEAITTSIKIIDDFCQLDFVNLMNKYN